MYRTFSPGHFLTDIDRLQRHLQRLAQPASTIRGLGRTEFPALNIGSSPDAIELNVFAPGLDPASIDLTVERGVLTIAGERVSDLPVNDDKQSIHINERFTGSFHRAVSLSDDADPNQVSARYTDGILYISIQRQTAAQRRRIEIH